MGEKFVREVGKLEQKLWENVWLKREEGRGGVGRRDSPLPFSFSTHASTVTNQRNPTV